MVDTYIDINIKNNILPSIVCHRPEKHTSKQKNIYILIGTQIIFVYSPAFLFQPIWFADLFIHNETHHKVLKPICKESPPQYWSRLPRRWDLEDLNTATIPTTYNIYAMTFQTTDFVGEAMRNKMLFRRTRVDTILAP